MTVEVGSAVVEAWTMMQSVTTRKVKRMKEGWYENFILKQALRVIETFEF